MQKVALVAFRGETLCFVHVMLYALDFHAKGYDVGIIMEGEATKLVGELAGADAPFAPLYSEISEKGLIDCVCRACSSKMGTLEEAESQGLRIAGEMKGHPSMERYISEGFHILTF